MMHYPTVKDNADLEFLSTPQCKVRNSSYEFAVISKNKILRDFWETKNLKNGLNRRFWKKIASLWLRMLRFESFSRARQHLANAIKLQSNLIYLKGKSSLMIFDRHANLKYKYGNWHFRAREYFVDTVGRNKKQIQEYIRNQLTEDKIADQIDLKEFVDPFTGIVSK